MAEPFFKFEMKGTRELDRALAQLPNALGKAVLRNTGKKALLPVAVGASRRAPRGRGRGPHLADSIIVGTRLSKRQRTRLKGGPRGVVLYVGPSGAPGSRAHLIEFGTGPRISPTTGKSSGQVAAQPFMRPSWEANKKRVLNTVGQELWVELAKAARRLSRQSAKFAKRFG